MLQRQIGNHAVGSLVKERREQRSVGGPGQRSVDSTKTPAGGGPGDEDQTARLVAAPDPVLSHLQRLREQPAMDTTMYRTDIAGFQRRHSSAEIAAHQRSVLGPPAPAPIEQDSSPMLRRKGDDGNAVARSGRLKSGPTYTPNGKLTAAKTGDRQGASFTFAAEFDHDPKNGIYASCCQVRQYISWTGTPPNHAGFNPASSFSANNWYEDRDSVDKRYGHRSGPHSENIVGNRYLDSKGAPDLKKGTRYEGSDAPRVKDGTRKPGETWNFVVKVIDTCNGDNVLGQDSVSVSFV